MPDRLLPPDTFGDMADLREMGYAKRLPKLGQP